MHLWIIVYRAKYQRANQSFISMNMNYASGWRPKDCMPNNFIKVMQGTNTTSNVHQVLSLHRWFCFIPFSFSDFSLDLRWDQSWPWHAFQHRVQNRSISSSFSSLFMLTSSPSFSFYSWAFSCWLGLDWFGWLGAELLFPVANVVCFERLSFNAMVNCVLRMIYLLIFVIWAFYFF